MLYYRKREAAKIMTVLAVLWAYIIDTDTCQVSS